MSMTISGAGGASACVVSGASQSMSPQAKMGRLYDKIDTDNSGGISKSEFEQAFQTMKPPAGIKAMGADAVFAQLDPNKTGNVSKEDFVSGMKGVIGQSRHHHHKSAKAADGASATPASSANSTQASSANSTQASSANSTQASSATGAAPDPAQSLAASLQSLTGLGAKASTAGANGTPGALLNILA